MRDLIKQVVFHSFFIFLCFSVILHKIVLFHQQKFSVTAKFITAKNIWWGGGFLKFIYLFVFIFGCVGSSLLRTGFLQLQRAGATLCCGAWAFCCSGFCCCRAWALGAWASVVVAHGLSSCGLWGQLLCGTQALPGPGIEPVTPALAGRFLTTVPPRKPGEGDF